MANFKEHLTTFMPFWTFISSFLVLTVSGHVANLAHLATFWPIWPIFDWLLFLVVAFFLVFSGGTKMGKFPFFFCLCYFPLPILQVFFKVIPHGNCSPPSRKLSTNSFSLGKPSSRKLSSTLCIFACTRGIDLPHVKFIPPIFQPADLS